MYAMLTGNLPFTVEPFNIKALHGKMLRGEINKIPPHLSKGNKENMSLTTLYCVNRVLAHG